MQEYKKFGDTYYHKETPNYVMMALERARKNGDRIRVFYGDSQSGQDWLETWDTMGYVRRSTGAIKIPLLVHNKRSFGGSAILDHCIVKITVNKRIVYQHADYHLGDIEIKQAGLGYFGQEQSYAHGVFRDGDNIANFKSLKQAENFVAFLQGDRNKL